MGLQEKPSSRLLTPDLAAAALNAAVLTVVSNVRLRTNTKNFREDWIHGFTTTTPIFPWQLHRWPCLCLFSFLELLVSLSCTGGVANLNGGIFLLGLRSFLLSEAFFQCQAEPSGRRLRSGEKNTVCVSYPHNIHLMPCTDSGIIHVNALGTSIIILNSYEVASDLLDKRSGIYSDR